MGHWEDEKKHGHLRVVDLNSNERTKKTKLRDFVLCKLFNKSAGKCIISHYILTIIKQNKMM